MSLQDKFLQLFAPSPRLRFDDLKRNKPYDIKRFTLVQHKTYGDSIVCEIVIKQNVRSLFLPKRFAVLAADIDSVNREIEQGKKWVLEWDGPTADKTSHLVKIYTLNM